MSDASEARPASSPFAPPPAKRLPVPASHAPARGARYFGALVVAWLSFGTWILALLLVVLALLAGGGYALFLPMLFVWTSWIWSLVGVIALLLTIGIPQCTRVRTLASFGIALHVLSFVTFLLLYG
ncbi:hypothetical protein [Microbacterium sp. NPDC087665]|uniref:hypothetical protein n=1 Tax=Microbacterium sp. NPDC087665 TaxID=3364194 RepID=UPI0037F15DDA